MALVTQESIREAWQELPEPQRLATDAAIKMQCNYPRKFSGALMTGKATREGKEKNGDFPSRKYQGITPSLLHCKPQIKHARV